MKYTLDMLKKFDMVNAKSIKTPMPTNGHRDLNDEGKANDTKVYRSMIGSLLYLCASRPDIMLRPCLVELWLWEKAAVGCELWKSYCGL